MTVATRALLALGLVLATAATARADHAERLALAERLLADGSSEEANGAAHALLADATLLPAERAQAHRIAGLSAFYLGRQDEAEQSLRSYLQLEPDAHLDPALVPPEAVVFFERVRTQHSGELLIAKPRPKRKRYAGLNLLPPFGQFQNGDRTKGWIIAGAGVALLATNITTYTMLRSSCDADLTCTRDPSSARTLRVVNLGAGAALFGLYLYGVIDGYIGYRQDEGKRPWAVAPMLDGGQPTLGAQAAFSF